MYCVYKNDNCNDIYFVMYNLDLYQFAPHDSRRFIKMDDEHNYGKRLMLVCWVSGSDQDGIHVSDYLALFYKHELQNIERVGVIGVCEGVQKIKIALQKHQHSNTFKFYHSYICVSVKRYLAQLLDNYSYFLLYHKSAQRIQLIWLERYYNPNDTICQKRLTREFNELHQN